MRLPNRNQVAFFGEPSEPLQPIEARSPVWNKSVRVRATLLVIRLRLASASSRFGVHCLAKHMNTHYLYDFDVSKSVAARGRIAWRRDSRMVVGIEYDRKSKLINLKSDLRILICDISQESWGILSKRRRGIF